MTRILWALSALMLAPSALFAQDLVEKAPGQFWSTSQLGLSRMCSYRAPGLWVTMLLDRSNPNNQRVLARSQDQALGYGECADFFIAWGGNECIQRDVFYGIPVDVLQRGFTYAEIRDYEIGGDDRIFNASRCTTTVAPPPPPPPPPPSCVNAVAQYRNFPGYDWLATSAPWYPTVRGPYALPAVMAAGGPWSQMVITSDDYHRSNPDLGGTQAHEQVRIYYWPSGIVSAPTDDVPSDVLSVKSDMGVVNLPPGQTHFYLLHAGPINLDAEGTPIPSDSVRPSWATWQSQCPAAR